jgi:hypothetical protein
MVCSCRSSYPHEADLKARLAAAIAERDEWKLRYEKGEEVYRLALDARAQAAAQLNVALRALREHRYAMDALEAERAQAAADLQTVRADYAKLDAEDDILREQVVGLGLEVEALAAERDRAVAEAALLRDRVTLLETVLYQYADVDNWHSAGDDFEDGTRSAWIGNGDGWTVAQNAFTTHSLAAAPLAAEHIAEDGRLRDAALRVIDATSIEHGGRRHVAKGRALEWQAAMEALIAAERRAGAQECPCGAPLGSAPTCSLCGHPPDNCGCEPERAQGAGGVE